MLRTGIVEIYSLLPFGQSALMASHSVPNAAGKLALSDDIVLVKASNRLIYLDCSEVFAFETDTPDEGLPPAYTMNVYPNPFSGDATISFDLPAGSDRFAENPIAKLDVYNLRGQKIRTLITTRRSRRPVRKSGMAAMTKAPSAPTGFICSSCRSQGAKALSRRLLCSADCVTIRIISRAGCHSCCICRGRH